MRNQFAGKCMDCGKLVAIGAGHPHKLQGGGPARWGVRHFNCVIVKRRADAQAERRLPYKDD